MLVWPIQDDVAAGFQSSEGPQWPTGGEVLLLSTLPCLFPCSDFAHPVTTPYMLTLAQVRTLFGYGGFRDGTLELICAALL